MLAAAAAILKPCPPCANAPPCLLLPLCSGMLVPGSRKAVAVRVRLGEKEALDATLRFFEERIDKLQVRLGSLRLEGACWFGPRSAECRCLGMRRQCSSMRAVTALPSPTPTSRNAPQGMEFYAERRLKRLGLLDDNGLSTWDDFFSDGIA